MQNVDISSSYIDSLPWISFGNNVPDKIPNPRTRQTDLSVCWSPDGRQQTTDSRGEGAEMATSDEWGVVNVWGRRKEADCGGAKWESAALLVCPGGDNTQLTQSSLVLQWLIGTDLCRWPLQDLRDVVAALVLMCAYFSRKALSLGFGRSLVVWINDSRI